MRFVPIKTDDKLDMQSLRRVRERWVMCRTAVINQIRGLLLDDSSQSPCPFAPLMAPLRA